VSLFEIWNRPLDPSAVTSAVAHPGAGAVDLFIGLVRNHSLGQWVTRLEYEAYPSMARKEMRKLAEEIRAELPEVQLAALHRVGSLAVGEVAVVCAASAPHRAEAFLACRRLINEIKARVPIWKREWGPSGPYWVGWHDARCEGGDHGAPGTA